MRKKDREIIDQHEIEAIISKADTCRIAFFDEPAPYIVAMNFGYQPGRPGRLYFHCANEGKKLDLLKKNNNVCFQMDTAHELITSDTACDYGMKYKSIVGTGTIRILSDTQEKIHGLNILMKHYSGKDSHSYNEKILSLTTVLCLEIIQLTAKQKK